MAQQSGAAVAKKLCSSAAAADAYTGEDWISALPDDLLVLILLRLDTTAEAVRTSVLSHRWRPVWKLLPELRFDNAPDLVRIRELIDVPVPGPEAPELRFMSVTTEGADPESAAAWLPAAARRVTGDLVFVNYDVEGEAEEQEQERGVVQLPCFTKARGIELDLGFLELALPSDGTFTRLTELFFFRVLFQGPCQVGDVVSSPRCPSLRRLGVQVCRGTGDGLIIRSESLHRIHLAHLIGFRRLTVETPALKRLAMGFCLESYYSQEDYENDGGGGGDADADVAAVGDGGADDAAQGNDNDPIVHITAPQLVSLGWDDRYDPQYVHFGNVEQLQQLSSYLYVYLQQNNQLNHNCLRLLQRFQVIKKLTLKLVFQKDLAHDLQYVMEDITMLPKIMSLKLRVFNRRHAFGASCFHLLRMCTSIQSLTFQFHETPSLEVQHFCPSGCLCEQPTEWKTEKLTLMDLEEVVIINTNGTDHEIAIFERLFDWAVKLKMLRFKYHSNTESKVNEVHQRLQRLARLETCIIFEELAEQ
ncbi:hypothetical protein SORBI_3002G016800 [Sorghum bicolor]|uniref:F-box domain-containing protein n=2 Tax=Sorghum bicolor TaxID=4558 RepID=A0A1B6Q8S1_SORBI|nr:hypothetical protein SORBI_3002G016800 [Sorghum bicolor]